MEIKVKVEWGAEAIAKALEKLGNVVASGCGAIFRPWIVTRDARAEMEVAKIRLLGSQELERLSGPARLPATSTDSEVLKVEVVATEERAVPLLRERARSRFEYQEAKRQLNVEDVVYEAKRDLEINPKVDERPVDDDWTARFFTDVQDVSSEQMKGLWAKILAGEIRRPGSFSLRCLEVVRNMTRDEAVLFEKACGYLVFGNCILAQDGGDPWGLLFAEFLRLVDAGIMNPAPVLTTLYSVERMGPQNVVSFADVVVLLTSEMTQLEFNAQAWKLTGVGTELVGLFESKADPAYVRWFCERARAGLLTATVHGLVDIGTEPKIGAELLDF